MISLSNLIRFAVGGCALAFAPAAASAQTADYAMHEWGLVTFTTPQSEFLSSGHDVRVLAIPDMPTEIRRTAKPVIYLTPGPLFDTATSVSVTVSIPEGILHEIYPLAVDAVQPVTAALPAYQWNNITFQGEGCGAEFAPQITAPECTSLGPDSVCEAAELPLYLRPVDVCLSVDGVSAPILLWNAINYNWLSPVANNGAALPAITNTSDNPLSGVFVRAGDGVQYLGQLEAGATISASVDAPALVNQTQLVDAVRVELLGQGLTANEADDFIDAWRPDQLQFPPPWTTFGFFDAEIIDARATLTLTPPPSERVRVLAFVTE